MPVNTAVAEQCQIEELSENENDSETEQEPPDEIIMMSQRHDDVQDDGQDDAAEDGQAEGPRTEQRGPEHERCVHGEINESRVFLVDSTIPYDENLVRAETEIKRKYLDLAHEVSAMWHVESTEIIRIVISANGLTPVSLAHHLRRLGFRSNSLAAIWVPLDRSEVFFSTAQPYELEPLSGYFLRELSEAEHLFTSTLEFAEEIFSDWSPYRSSSPTNLGL